MDATPTPDPTGAPAPDPTGAPTPDPTGAARQHRVPTWAIGLALFAVFVVIAAVVTHGGAPNYPSATTTHTVVYQLTTTGPATSADVTYKTPTGIEQQQDVDVPFDGVTLPNVASGEFLSISGQLKGDAQDITCTITVDGLVVAKNTSSGEFAIATCDGTA